VKIKYYLLRSGRSPVEEFLQEQSDIIRTDFLDAINLLASGHRIPMPLSRNLSSLYRGLHELRLKDKSGQVRIFYFIKKGKRFICCMLCAKKRRKFLRRKSNRSSKGSRRCNMAWKEMSVEEIADSMGISIAEVRAKQNLIRLIVKERKEKKLSQARLAKKLGVSQGRIAQIESGIGTSQVTFDVLLHILSELGYSFKIVTKKAA
jgi:DNA-binding XRE family transcriptional regulator